jgi:hypothetical protein
MAHRSSVAMIVIDYPWTKTKEDAAAFYNVEETKGLSEERVKRDFERYGPNGRIHCIVRYPCSRLFLF